MAEKRENLESDKEFSDSRFSLHFNRLAYLGIWTCPNWWSPSRKKFFFLQRLVFRCLLAAAIFVQVADLYIVFGNIRKVIFNISTSAIVVGYSIKMVMLYKKKDYLNELRMDLWKDSVKLKDVEEVALQDSAYKQLKYIATTLYVACCTFLPLILISSFFSYHWGPRQLPFAAYWPMSDPMDNYSYMPPFIFEAICGFLVIMMAIEAELSTMSLALQIKAYYQILKRDILKLNDIYGDVEDVQNSKLSLRREVNAFLMKDSAKELIKDSIKRHLKLIEYTERLEFIFCYPMLIHIFTLFSLTVLNCVEITMFSDGISMKLCFQVGFISMALVDFLFVCHYMSEVTLECSDMGNAVYSTTWHKMDADLRRRLCLMIMRTSKTPKFTAGKIFILDLKTYLNIVKHAYSWLMLMRHVITK